MKLMFFTEQHRPLVVRRILKLVHDEEARPLVVEHASRANNLVRAVVEAIAVAYSRGVRRELRGLGEPAARAFRDIVRESGMAELGWSVNGLSWLCGPLPIGPCMVENRLQLDVLSAAVVDVKRIDQRRLRSAVWRAGGGWVELDEEAWRYFDQRGQPYKVVPHTVGRCPLAIFRCDSYLGFDALSDDGWWCASEHAGLVDASLDLAYKHAFGLWTRHNGSTPLTVVAEELENIPPGQTIAHPMFPFVLRGTNGSVPVNVFDRTVNPAEYLAEMRAIVEGAVSRYGISGREIDFSANNNDWGTLAINVRGDRLGLLRDKQVPWLLAGERALWGAAVDLLRGSAHRHRGALPPSDELEDALRISIPDLASSDEIKKSIEALQSGLGLGVTSVTGYMMERRPELTAEEVDEERTRNVDDYAKTIEMVASRNIPTGNAGKGVESVAQIQGREGGRRSGEVRRETGDEA